MTRSTVRAMALFGAPLLFGACAAYAFVSIALHRVWPGFVWELRVGFGLVDAALWLASAVILGMRTKKALWVPVLGAFMLLAESTVARAGGSVRELVYLGVLPLIVALESVDIKHVLGIDREETTLGAVPVTA